MPELPDLTVFAESLEKIVLDKTIRRAVYHREKRINVDPGFFCSTIQGQKITGVRREGKALLFQLSGGDTFLVHLMLSGGFLVSHKNEEVQSAVLTLLFDDGQSLVLFDQRGLATVTLNPDLARTALDALKVSREYLQEKIKQKPRVTVKELLIDQSILAGIGNAYSDEILWRARISPKSIAGKLPDKAIEELVSAIHRVLKESTEYLRANSPGMISGEVREHLAVHKPKAKTSPTGAKIMVEVINTKKTYFTDEQVLYK